MITIFTTPKAFHAGNNIIQRNALRSWLNTQTGCEIMLFGDDDGVEGAAREFNVRHYPSVEKNELGTPLLSSMFDIAQRDSSHSIIMYINADIILTRDVFGEVKFLGNSPYLLSGRRWDLNVEEEIDYGDEEWANRLLEKAKRDGALHGYAGMDYFVFPKGVVKLPPFSVGRPGWDSWLIYHMKTRGVPILNATSSIHIIHQNHDYSHSPYGGKKRVAGPEWRSNIDIAGGLSNMLSLREADWLVENSHLRKPELMLRVLSRLSRYRVWRAALAFRRRLLTRAQ